MNQWIISQWNFESETQRLNETLFTLGNGYFSCRGAHEDAVSDIHYSATYLGGIYNRLASNLADKVLVNEDLVNFPNWLAISFKIEDEEWFDITKTTILSYRHSLHLKQGIVTRALKFRDEKGRIFIINSMRFVSMHNPHQAAIRYSIIAQNWGGKIIIRSSIIGEVCNNGVPRYKDLDNQHLEIIHKGGYDDKCLFMQVKTNTSRVEVSEVIKTEIYCKKKQLNFQSTILEEEKNIHQDFYCVIEANQKITIHKKLAIFTSKDVGIYENLYEAKKLIAADDSLSQLLNRHTLAWSHLWYKADIEIDSMSNEQQLIRLHIFHSLQSLSPHSVHIDYGIPARGLHGEAYRGHVFWDEVFILPFFLYRFPHIARAMLMYRYYRLNAARTLANDNGFRGAMFPWQSASNGEEESQKYHLNPNSAQWGPDYSCYQRHVNLAIAYNIWSYAQMTHDIDFLNDYGAEIIFEIALFLVSITTFNETKKRYEINYVMGPDEYHECYPDSIQPGVNNNTYTNVMTVWVLEKALDLTQILSKERIKQLFEQLNIQRHDMAIWSDITQKMFIPFHNNLLSQFERYNELKEFNWAFYQEKYKQIERLDRILKAENQNPNEFKIAKQPDTLMLFYLLDEQELQHIFNKLGYPYSKEIKNNTINYYLQRTSHGSTLSKITFASLLFDNDLDASQQLFQEALVSDINDTQGGTTQEGIHLGVMVGTILILIKHYAGFSISHGLLNINPQLPKGTRRLKFKLLFKRNLYELEIFTEFCSITLCEKYNPDSFLYVHGQLIQLDLDKTVSCYYRRKLIQDSNEIFV